MDIIKLSKFLNQISEIETSYDDLSPKIQKAYQKKANWIIDFFKENGWKNNCEDNYESIIESFGS